LLTPYTGGNLGDAAIQDAMIANLRLRLPAIEISGITLNCDNFVERHGVGAFPLCGIGRPFYGMSQGSVANPPGPGRSRTEASNRKGVASARVRTAVKQAPAVWRRLKTIHGWVTAPFREFRHCVEGYRFLRTQDLLIVSGGGQLDEEWGGSLGHPYALFKWAVLALMARVPYAIASVGACKVTSAASRLFLSAALRMARYRSYRDNHSREIAAGLLRRAADDPVIADLAFTLQPPDRAPSIRSIAGGRLVVAISPIAYAKPRNWPRHDHDLYNRYLHQMAQVVSDLLKRGCFLVVVWSSLGDDQSVIPELVAHIDDDCRNRLPRQMHIPAIANWKDLVASLQEVDLLIASRLHSTILGFMTQTPTVAISFDPKVDWVMEDLGQRDYLLHIRDFTAGDVIRAIDRIEPRRNAFREQIASYQHRLAPISAGQYDALAALAQSHRRP
jgi:polysaccharide pyruvyl transferase WcaK-like protein